MQGQILDAGQKWTLPQSSSLGKLEATSAAAPLFGRSRTRKLETADVRVYIIFEIVTIRRWSRTGQEGRPFPASKQSDVLMEPWGIPLPRVVTRCWRPDPVRIKGANKSYGILLFVLG